MKSKKLETGVIGGIEKRVIEIITYDKNWPKIYEEHKKQIEEILAEIVISIEHIGSTSVPNLSAKPIIDMLLVVQDSADESKYLSKMESLGYQLRVREPDFHEHRMFRTVKKDVHIHVLSRGSSEITRYILFRNRLRENEDDRVEYENLKLKLADSKWQNMNDYARAKTEIIERIINSEKEKKGSA